MLILLSAVFSTLCSMFRSRAALELEHIALRRQIGVLKRSARKRPKLTAADRLFWVSSRGSGATGAQRWISLDPRPQSPGIARDFAFSGPGRSGRDTPVVRQFRWTFATSSAR